MPDAPPPRVPTIVILAGKPFASYPDRKTGRRDAAGEIRHRQTAEGVVGSPPLARSPAKPAPFGPKKRTMEWETLMSDQMHYPPAEAVARARVNAAQYEEMYKASVADPDGFWGAQGLRLDWIEPYSKVKHTSFDYHNVSIKWFEDGKLNVAANCVDRHLATRGDQTAIIWESDAPNLA